MLAFRLQWLKVYSCLLPLTGDYSLINEQFVFILQLLCMLQDGILNLLVITKRIRGWTLNVYSSLNHRNDKIILKLSFLIYLITALSMNIHAKFTSLCVLNTSKKEHEIRKKISQQQVVCEIQLNQVMGCLKRKIIRWNMLPRQV